MNKPIETIKLGSICNRITDGTHQPPKFVTCGVPFLFVSNIIDGKISFEKTKFVSGDEYLELDGRCPVEVGDVLYTIVGSYGNAAVVESGKPFSFQRHIAHIKPDPRRVFPRYLRACLVSHFVREQVDRRVRGIAQKTLNLSELRELEVPLPPLAEQRRIAAILDHAEALRAKRREVLQRFDELAQSIFFHIFGDLVKNSKAWQTDGIDSVCEEIVDCVNRTAPIVDHDTPYKMIRTSNVKRGKIHLDDVRCVTVETFERWNRRCVPQKGDVILTREAPVGEAGILDAGHQVFLGQRLMLYRPDSTRMTPEYLLYSFLGKHMQLQFDQQGSGSTVKHLPLPVCRSLQVRVPPIALQQEFARQVAAIDRLKAAHQASLAKLDELFASLQHRAFRGELTGAGLSEVETAMVGASA